MRIDDGLSVHLYWFVVRTVPYPMSFDHAEVCAFIFVCCHAQVCVSDAANCPFAVYPMGSGMSLVTACSLSLNGPVAMAAPHRAGPSPPSAWRVTGQLERGAVTCSLLWLQLWGENSQAGDTINRQGPNKIHLQTNMTSQGPSGHACSPSLTAPVPPLHVAPAIKSS